MDRRSFLWLPSIWTSSPHLGTSSSWVWGTRSATQERRCKCKKCVPCHSAAREHPMHSHFIRQRHLPGLWMQREWCQEAGTTEPLGTVAAAARQRRTVCLQAASSIQPQWINITSWNVQDTARTIAAEQPYSDHCSCCEASTLGSPALGLSVSNSGSL